MTKRFEYVERDPELFTKRFGRVRLSKPTTMPQWNKFPHYRDLGRMFANLVGGMVRVADEKQCIGEYIAEHPHLDPLVHEFRATTEHLWGEWGQFQMQQQWNRFVRQKQIGVVRRVKHLTLVVDNPRPVRKFVRADSHDRTA